ncbi:ABC transporter substrate-binding protein [Deinococcus ruber]|uniref:ABC transporter substrate-binding protein n=1 Tax=Deinococcus ruber TaxID=1848197 RepID=A0A918F3M5_9DEIO|nr:ABC transporter substrate-binding protein [Deinococcus ruber]
MRVKRSAALLTCTLLAFSGASAAPLQISFWHSMEGVKDLVAQYARDFNASQNQYEVSVTSVGNYREAPAKLQAAIKAGNPPTMFQAEFTYFSKLVGDGQLVNLDKYEAALPATLVNDFYPAVWKAGEVNKVRYGLPWNVSTPVLFYNAGVFRGAKLNPPKTWTELEATADKLGNGRRPLLVIADAWTFEGLVASRGGNVVLNGKPNFTSPEAVAALDQLARMVKGGNAQFRTLDDAIGAAFDFTRGQNLMVVASVANWTDFQKLPFVDLGAAPFPCEKICAVPLGGANIVLPKGSTTSEQAGAMAFWKFLMEPGRLNDWVKATAYVTPRRSVQPGLADYYAKNPYRKAAYSQLDDAVPRPTAPDYYIWQKYLEDAIQKATTGKMSAQAALQEAQAKANQ